MNQVQVIDPIQFAHQFRNTALAELALTHRSAGRPNNERLEYLGDAFLNCCVAELLFDRYAQASEGELTRMRAALVNGRALAEIARGIHLGEQLRLGPGEMKSGGHRRDSILADTFEALLGAVYLDAGFDAVRAVIGHHIEPRLAALTRSGKDAKTELQEWLQHRSLPLPDYALVNNSGPEHEPTFTVGCRLRVPELLEFFADAGSRRAAEQQAAAKALQSLKKPGSRAL